MEVDSTIVTYCPCGTYHYGAFIAAVGPILIKQKDVSISHGFECMYGQEQYVKDPEYQVELRPICKPNITLEGLLKIAKTTILVDGVVEAYEHSEEE